MAEQIEDIEEVDIQEDSPNNEEQEDVVSQPMEELYVGKEATIISDELSPVEDRTYCSWFLSLLERKDPAMLLRYKDLKPEILSPKSAGALRELFCTNKVHLYLPWWDLSNKTKNPTDWYEIKYASNTGKTVCTTRMFAGTYDPLIIKREKAGAIVGVIYANCLFKREKEMPMFIELLNELVADPQGFFDRMGKRWGHCLCCKREITADKSIQHAIGPVCYKRLKTLTGWVKKTMDEITPKDTTDEQVVPTARLLNPIEFDGVSRLNLLLKSYVASGMQFDEQFAMMLTPKDTVSQRLVTSSIAGDLRQKYITPENRWKYKTSVGRARKDSNVFVIEKATPYTVGMLLQVGAHYNPTEKVWMLPKEQTNDLMLHFRVAKESPADAQGTIVTTGEVLAPPPLSTVKKSTPKDRKLVVKAIAGDLVEVTGDTYPHKTAIKNAGGIWDRERKAWIVPLAAKATMDALAANVNDG